MEKQCKQIHDLVDDNWKKLDEIWRKIGHDTGSIQKRKTAVYKHTQQLFGEMLEEEGEKLSECQKKLENLYEEILQLLKDLTMDPSIGVEAKAKSHNKTLLEQEKVYENIAEDLRKKKAIRMEKYNKVNDQVVLICEEMDEDIFKISFEGIPSDAQVHQLEHKLTHFHKEKLRRQILFKKLKAIINTLFQCLERIPKNEFERVISSEEVKNTDIKILSLTTLHRMEELEATMHQELTTDRNEADRLWQKIRELWSRLKVGEELQFAFEKVHSGIQCQIGDKKEMVFKPVILQGLRSELKHLEEEKKRNIALFVGQVREELTALWKTKCFMEDTQFRFFSPTFASLTDFTETDFASEMYTEELLDVHEREVEYWRVFVERNKKMIDGVIKREQMFSQYRELDQKSDDPARLSNRGGALLREEKERKMLEKAIPKLENELKQLSSKFSQDRDCGHGMTSFLVYGQDIADLIEADWKSFHEEKEKRKEMRKKETGVNKTMMAAQTGFRAPKRPGTPSGMSTPKRAKVPPSTPTSGRTFATPISSSSSRNGPAKLIVPNTDGNFARPETRSRPPPSSSAKKIIGSKIPSCNTKKATKEQVNPIPPITGHVVSPSTSYTDFANPLLCQSTLNSSAFSTVSKTRKPLIDMPGEHVDPSPISSVPTKPERFINKVVPSSRAVADPEEEWN
ncbi:protein regulator of cytokinesis 1 isoform X4 [Folsomia candida]|uniref:protein regulator of cytokinesis 1 isoform X4 n=1 Tax=Folsomia candida TaxID=158441 RepID=UPI000B8EEECC|nr:protein regulator of cytokinesis 1 isoform X4 [Folsomia candida]